MNTQLSAWLESFFLEASGKHSLTQKSWIMTRRGSHYRLLNDHKFSNKRLVITANEFPRIEEPAPIHLRVSDLVSAVQSALDFCQCTIYAIRISLSNAGILLWGVASCTESRGTFVHHKIGG